MFHQDLFRQSQLLANPTNLVLKEVPQRLDQRKRHLFGQSADVVVRFDRSRRPLYGNRLDYVGIERSLYQVADLSAGLPRLELLRLLSKDSDELPADALAFFLGVGNPFQSSEKALRSVHAEDVEFQPVAQHLQGLLKLVLPQHPGIHEDIRQPGAHGPVHEHRRDRGIHAAAEPADGPLISHLLADRCGALLDKSCPAPLRFCFTHPKQKVSQ